MNAGMGVSDVGGGASVAHPESDSDAGDAGAKAWAQAGAQGEDEDVIARRAMVRIFCVEHRVPAT